LLFYYHCYYYNSSYDDDDDDDNIALFIWYIIYYYWLAALFIRIVTIFMCGIMIFHISSKYTAVGRWLLTSSSSSIDYITIN
jgi:hypothetical protein